MVEPAEKQKPEEKQTHYLKKFFKNMLIYRD